MSTATQVPAAQGKGRNRKGNVVPAVVLDEALIKTIMATAAGRDGGVVIYVNNSFGRPASFSKKIKVPLGAVKILPGGRIGFSVTGETYVTSNPTATEAYKTWLLKANRDAFAGRHYDQPGEVAAFSRTA